MCYKWRHHETLKACCEKSTEGSSRPTQWINCDGGGRQAGESWRGRLTSPLSATKATVTPRPAFKEPKSHFSYNFKIQLFIKLSYKSSSAPHLRVHTRAVSTTYTMRGTSLSRTHLPFTQAPLARAPPAVIQHSLLIISSCDLKLLPWGQTKITYKGPKNSDCRYMKLDKLKTKVPEISPHHIQFQSLVWSWPCALKSSSWTLFSPHALSLCYGQDAGLWGEEGRALHIPSAGHLGMEARLEMEERVSPPPLCLRDVVHIWTIWLWNIFGQTFQPALER